MKNNHIYLENASIFHLFIDEIFVFLLCNKNKIRRIITSFRVPDVEVQYIGNSKGRKENPTVVR